jgi:hypothetical protein
MEQTPHSPQEDHTAAVLRHVENDDVGRHEQRTSPHRSVPSSPPDNPDVTAVGDGPSLPASTSTAVAALGLQTGKANEASAGVTEAATITPRLGRELFKLPRVDLPAYPEWLSSEQRQRYGDMLIWDQPDFYIPSKFWPELVEGVRKFVAACLPETIPWEDVDELTASRAKAISPCAEKCLADDLECREFMEAWTWRILCDNLFSTQCEEKWASGPWRAYFVHVLPKLLGEYTKTCAIFHFTPPDKYCLRIANKAGPLREFHGR